MSKPITAPRGQEVLEYEEKDDIHPHRRVLEVSPPLTTHRSHLGHLMLLHNSNSLDLVTLTPPTVSRAGRWAVPRLGPLDGARVEPEHEHDEGQDRQGAALAPAVAGGGSGAECGH